VKLSGWGRYPVIEARACAIDDETGLKGCLASGAPAIAHGLGRSYGDSALGHSVLLMRPMAKYLAFDPVQGLLTCEAGVSLDEIVRTFLPRGWFLRVTPGTRFITLGGAIASDVHGKNHHKEGCFSSCVQNLELMLPDGRVLTCSPVENGELFRATCGGMGLTGVILRATIALLPVRSGMIDQTVAKAASLERVFELFERHADATYSVAWIDCLAGGACMGRSLLMLGEHAQDGPLEPPAAPRASIPFDLPGWLLNKWSISAFNAIYFNRIKAQQRTDRVPLAPFFYPLDAVTGWNRMYGKAGFTQYQAVLPLEASRAGLALLLRRIARSGLGSFLAVLKLFGQPNDNPLSFPMRGYTLALDFKIVPRLFPLLDELDRIVVDHGGRLYLSKDARMSPATLRAGYPSLDSFLELRARLGLTAFQSLQSQRLGI
jgi:decaprenylphospho-beta-D-ribofuranose 2-oxidase